MLPVPLVLPVEPSSPARVLTPEMMLVIPEVAVASDPRMCAFLS